MKLFSKLLTMITALLALMVGPALAEKIKIGVVLPYSGGAAQFGEQIDRGMNLFISQNKDAFGGHEIEIIKRDSKRPGGDIAKNAVQELITREKVNLLTGFVFSPNAMASAPLVTQGKVPMVIMNAGTAWIPKLSPYIARVSFTMWHAGYPMGEYAFNKLGCKSAAIGFTDYPPGKDSRNAFTTGFEKAGGKVVEAIPMGGPREVPDFTPFFQRVKNAKPDCFYIFVPAGNHSVAVVKTYANLGMRDEGIKLIGPGDITQDTKLQDMPKEAEGMITVHHYSADYDTPNNKAFVKAWKDAYGADTTPDFMGVAGYDGMAAIAHAISEQKGKISAEGTMKALSGWSYDSPRGKIMIDPETRDIVHDSNVHKVVSKDGRLMIEVIDSIPQVKDPCKANAIGKCK
ncbi:MAG: ABC transporter substrate-binding protein [Hyphomicrobiales bacterium]